MKWRKTNDNPRYKYKDFCCNSNRKLAEDIAKHVGIPMGNSDVSTLAMEI